MTGDHSKELGVETRLSDQGSNGDDKNGVELTGIRGSQRTLGTSHDIEDMRVLGKLQELRVRPAADCRVQQLIDR
jgi:hypothetical protein